MAIKHNNQIPNNHFRKQWQTRVRTHFDQPGRKLRRRNARLAKAAKVAPRPVDSLRPIVRCPTIKYNRRVRAGRGFSLDELKEAGIPKQFARTIGISVDHRRKNVSVEALQANVERLKAYQSKLILFPRKSKKPKSGDSSAEDIKAASQQSLTAVFPIENALGKRALFEERAVPAGAKDVQSYRRLREARAEHRYAGAKAKRAADKTEAAEKK